MFKDAKNNLKSKNSSVSMKLDAELMFECLIYLNVYYFAVFGTCELMMIVAKRYGPVYTPKIYQDAGVVLAMLATELLKILLYRRFKDDHRDLVTFVSVLLTMVTILGTLYTYILQYPIIKLEYILCIMEDLLAGTEVIFGILQIMPCCKKVQYY